MKKRGPPPSRSRELALTDWQQSLRIIRSVVKRKCRDWWLPGWAFKRKRHRARFADVRQRDGDHCWRCGHPMVFDGSAPNCGRAATLEHVQPLSKGGNWALDNLRLCHVGCNRHLGDNDPAQKERMRLPLAREHFAQN